MKKIVSNFLALAMAFMASVAFADLRQAEELMKRRDYLNAAPEFFQAYSYAKSPMERSRAELGLARSLEAAGLFYSASKYFSLIARRGPGGRNPFFSEALDALGRINDHVSLGRSHVVKLFQVEVDPALVPGKARGFYFYYKGIEAFDRKQFNKAQEYLSRVSAGSSLYPKAQFHLGVVFNLNGDAARAVSSFERSMSEAKGPGADWLKEQANLNIARVYYEKKDFRKSMRYYAEIPRRSDSWLQAMFESSWAFFILQKFNNTLGNIHTLHSPFFENRFFPESYILQSITFLRLCRFTEVKKSLSEFKERYKGIFRSLSQTISENQGEPAKFYSLVRSFRNEGKSGGDIAPILDSLSRTDNFRDASATIKSADTELAKLSRAPSKWQSMGIQDELNDFLSKKKYAAASDAGRRMLANARANFSYLQDLSNQTRFINLEMQLGKIDKLRAELNVTRSNDKNLNFIGGLQELEVGQDLEYWPFQGEYWEDELGGYVYNLDSKCTASDAASGKGK